jgi:nucleoside-diphosphate-sugar epimerase
VFLAGGSGVIGRRLIPQLVAAGHEVTATTRRPEKADLLRSLGAAPTVVDALDEQAVVAAVLAARAEAVVHQLTDLPPRYDPARLGPWYERTSRLRVEGTRHLLAGAAACGARRVVFQSIAFLYRLEGPAILDEDAPVWIDAPEPFGTAVRATVEGERLVLEATGIDGVVLRYGQLYGPGTYFAADGDIARRARGRMLPVVGGGRGLASFIHVDDAASAAVCALSRAAASTTSSTTSPRWPGTGSPCSPERCTPHRRCACRPGWRGSRSGVWLPPPSPPVAPPPTSAPGASSAGSLATRAGVRASPRWTESARRALLASANVGLQVRPIGLQLADSRLHQIAHADDAAEFAVDHHRQVPNPSIGHDPQDVIHFVGEHAADHFDVHDLRDRGVNQRSSALVQVADEVALPDHAHHRAVVDDDHSTDAVPDHFSEQNGDRRVRRNSRDHRPLSVQYIRYPHRNGPPITGRE